MIASHLSRDTRERRHNHAQHATARYPSGEFGACGPAESPHAATSDFYRLSSGAVSAPGRVDAINVIGYLHTGTFSDYPDCIAPALARILHSLNDFYADRDGWISSNDSRVLVNLAGRTPGTGSAPSSAVHTWMAALLTAPWGPSNGTGRHIQGLIADTAAFHDVRASSSAHTAAPPSGLLERLHRRLRSTRNSADQVAQLEAAASAAALGSLTGRSAHDSAEHAVRAMLTALTTGPLPSSPRLTTEALRKFTVAAIDAWHECAGSRLPLPAQPSAVRAAVASHASPK